MVTAVVWIIIGVVMVLFRRQLARIDFLWFDWLFQRSWPEPIVRPLLLSVIGAICIVGGVIGWFNN